MSQGAAQKIRILALHGYTQSAAKFKEKSSLPRKFKKLTEFIFITAPFRVPLIDEDLGHTVISNDKPKETKLIEHRLTDIDGSFIIKEEALTPEDYPTEDTDSFAWFLRRPNETKTGHVYRGLKECIEYIEGVFKEMGPFDGVYGFSQGACLVEMLCALQQKNLTKHIKFDFAIMAGAYKFVIDEFYDEQLVIPSLHIYGETDQRVVPERSRQVASYFENPVVVSHPGGHFVPQKKEYEPFIVKQWNRKFGSSDGPTS